MPKYNTTMSCNGFFGPLLRMHDWLMCRGGIRQMSAALQLLGGPATRRREEQLARPGEEEEEGREFLLLAFHSNPFLSWAMPLKPYFLAFNATLRPCVTPLMQLMRSLEFMATKVRKGQLARDWIDEVDEGTPRWAAGHAQ